MISTSENGSVPTTPEELNTDEIKRLLPLIIYLVFISVIGFIGNSFVLYFYKTKFPESNSRYFIICLSLMDLFSCCIVLPFEITVVLKQYTFEEDVICKTLRFMNTLPTVSACFLFIAIAVERYRKVCRPFGWQIAPRVVKWICLGTIFCGLLLSWPGLFLYGKRTFYVKSHNINATECSVSDSMKGKIVPFLHSVAFGVIFIVWITSIAVLYIITGRAIRKQTHRFGHNQPAIPMTGFNNTTQDKTHSASNRTSRVCCCANGIFADFRISSFETTDDDIGDLSTSHSREINSVECGNAEDHRFQYKEKHENENKTLINVSSSLPGTMPASVDKVSTSMRGNVFSGCMDTGKTLRKREIRAKNISMLMFLVTLAYILSFLPHVLLMVIRVVDKSFVESMTNTGRAVYKFFLRSYVLNYAVNPFIYFAFDTRFRKAFRNIIRTFCRKLH